MIKDNLLNIGIFNVILIFLLLPSNAAAYVGPGAGLSAFGSLFALAVALIIAVIGFVWFPIKRLIKNLNNRIK